MSGIKAEKLSDEALEHVSGGTNREIMDLQLSLGVSNIKDVYAKLRDLGIKPELSSMDENKYFDQDTENTLNHEQVLSRIQWGKK